MANIFTRMGRALRLVESSSPVENADQPKKVDIHVEAVGSSGTENYAGYYSEEYLQNLRGTLAADLWDKMRRSDPKIRMALSAVKNPIKGAQWLVQPGDESPEAKKHSELVEQILFKDLEQSWTQQLSEILTYVDYGFSLFEVINKVVVDHKKFGSYNSVAKLAWRSPRTIERWNLDPKNGALLSVSQYAFGDLQRTIDIPAQHLMVFTHEKEGDNYEGVSALRPCYGPWLRKNAFLKLMAIGIEKFAVPTPYMEVPEGKEASQEYANAKKILERYVSHQQQYITVPAGWKLSFASPSNFDAGKLREAINAENTEISHAFLENFLELGSSGTGSYALGTDLSDFFLMGLEHLGNHICEVFNKGLIPQLVKLNFGPQEVYPELKCTGIKDKPGTELASILATLIGAKVITPDALLEESMREKYGFSKKEIVAAAPAVVAPPALAVVPKLAETIKLGPVGIWSTASDEKVCEECGPLDGQETTREPPLHPNCRCTKSTQASESKKLSEAGAFALQRIEVSKKAALTEDEARRLASEVTTLPLGQPMEQSETHYRFNLVDSSLLDPGTLKTFEPMEGVLVTYGKRTAIPASTPVSPTNTPLT